MARIRSSWFPSKTLVVDSPFLKPEMLGSKKRLLINIVDELLEHQTLEDLGERGKYRDRSILCVLFWIVDFRDGWDVCRFPDAWKLRIRDAHIDDTCKRTRKEISNLFCILDGNLVNASRTVQSKQGNLFENFLSGYRAELERITIGLNPLDRWPRLVPCPVFSPLSW